ncbi:DUF4398 domain-containing protein [Gilvimarinus xylanilyticus]|uniref:DUF4398 domain-containing protein n=1 Tax=Gilvimarinus xylanilyticus TaxID=2944139 RepID=A0A9X2I513_9GAMM|nr:DUF4398 domain-containing protein [Gilvimarinus xylanilyticus]MCP8900111.1 DUF4398 domain-containing protein [Gilvimarinus xylanilyticus]
MKSVWLMIPLLCTLLAVGCATQNPVSESMVAQTEARIDQAKSLNADRYAPVALRDAEKHYQSAERAMSEENYDQARQLLEKAMADAELAVATSHAKKSQQAANELEENLRALEAEVQ